VFSTRCPHAEAECRDAEPELEEELGHTVACRRWREIVPPATARSRPALASGFTG
jgi:hypothetical protein